ncbi:hypothetical protein SDC9_76203 [bioreactor metagenome]|uniref:Uncharacterized protein n=1 Tax=bioreactor metagenome TaxID=1076179 RepID=A0A644YT63_9ZZZZ
MRVLRPSLETRLSTPRISPSKQTLPLSIVMSAIRSGLSLKLRPQMTAGLLFFSSCCRGSTKEFSRRVAVTEFSGPALSVPSKIIRTASWSSSFRISAICSPAPDRHSARYPPWASTTVTTPSAWDSVQSARYPRQAGHRASKSSLSFDEKPPSRSAAPSGHEGSSSRAVMATSSSM